MSEVFWGKSDPTEVGLAARVPMPLLQHLFDTAAVAELVYDRVVAPSVRTALDAIAPEGDGRRWFAWIAGAHDVGKASAFQALDEELGRRVQAAGLRLDRSVKVRHEQVSAWILKREARAASWSRRAYEWVPPLLDGHHGRFSAAADVKRVRAGFGDEDGPWSEAQRELLSSYTETVGYRDLLRAQPTGRPPRAIQLALAGWIVTCDWVASNGAHFEGLPFDRCSFELARDRAAKAVDALGLASRWPTAWSIPDAPIEARFGREGSRPFQREVIEHVQSLSGPALIILEAPMGEGKTEAGMAAAELLAARNGAHGIVVAMPTQATSDQIFSRLADWAARMPFEVPLTLLHGRRSLHPRWNELLRPGGDQAPTGLDPYGEPVEEPSLGQIAEDAPDERAGAGVAQWWDGRYKGLGADGLAVCTIDQPLLAATRTKFVSLRFAGLVGKVLLLDEVHAADVYMSEFLHELLRWLGQAGVPVVAMSATLPAGQRRALVEAYLAGAEPDRASVCAPTVGYPQVTLAEADRSHVPSVSPAWRASYPVQVTLADLDDEEMGGLLDDLLVDGGCALVVRNTVARAQDAYRTLRQRYSADEVRLLHARFLADHRSADTADVVRLLGGDEAERPQRLIVVGTQVVEQSLDLDADVLVSDIAPVDLLLQRAGRLHRHDRSSRPARVAEPRIYVTGVTLQPEGPDLDGGARAVYGAWLLARTTALLAAGTTTWSLPDDIPSLVEAVYDGTREITPPGWSAFVEEAKASAEDAERQRRSNAAQRVLAGEGDKRATTLVNLHVHDSKVDTNDDAMAAAAVRDGDPTVEVVVVRFRDGQFLTAADERPLGVHGEAARGFARVAGSTMRLPARLGRDGDRPLDLTAAALQLGPLPAWIDDPQLKHLRVWCLDDCDLDAVRIPQVDGNYDRRLGLTLETCDA